MTPPGADNPTADHFPEDQPPPPPRRARSGARFAPGETLAGRYRVVAFLGRGGMGEVYRAEDTRLDVEVALKFLSPELASDAALLARLHAETRLAREVAHRHVCRVFDAGELPASEGGGAFISMEYVDGEDLASLLRRIGRMPRDKAAQAARQLCAGLAAAHERGVVHRDLKPSNVMIDGRGDVKLADFGIAARAASGEGGRSGTLLYMSPEQLRGEPATVASDVFALGLVLYEMYTGRRGFVERDAASGAGAHIEPASSIDPEIDPAVERVIHRCLEDDPARRPAGALAVAAGLPGGDPLRAALEAGETPSPELVAASGGAGSLAPRAGAALLLVAALGFFAADRLATRTTLLAAAPPPLSADALADRAVQAMRTLGHTERARDTALDWQTNPDYVRWVWSRGGDARERLRAEPGAAFRFFYRDSPSAFEPIHPFRHVGWNDPPADQRGMRRAMLDAAGRLVWFRSTPPAVIVNPAAEAPPPIDWRAAFTAAGLDFDRFTPSPERRVWHADAGESFAWDGPAALLDGANVRVHAGATLGRITQFEVRFPWEMEGLRENVWRAPPEGGSDGWGDKALGVVVLVLTCAAALVARRNLISGRGDRRGALRVAASVFVVMSAGILLQAHNLPSPMRFIAGNSAPLALAAWLGLVIWMLYVAVEPVARRTWPAALVSWARLLRGDWRDPLVGRDALIGLAAGGVMTGFAGVARLINQGDGPPLLSSGSATLLGGSRMLAICFGGLAEHLMWAMGMLATLVLITTAARSRAIGCAAALLVVASMNLLGLSAQGPAMYALAALVAVVQVALLARVGLLAGFTSAAAAGFAYLAPGLDWSAWPARSAWVPWAFIAAAAAWSYSIATRRARAA